MTSHPARVLVVGASAAGLATTEALRRRGYQGELTVLGAEPHAPYDRPPLSKQVLSGAWEPGRAALRPSAHLSALDAEFILGDPAAGLDAATRTVRTGSGRTLRADAIVVATGLRPRALPRQDGLSGVHVLRTLEDAAALRADLLTAARVVVVGDGVLAAEIAVAAAILGDDRPYAPVPYMWTDQFETKIQVHGLPDPDAEVTVVDGAVADRRFVARYRRDGRVIGLLGWNMPKQVRLRRQEVVDGLPGLAPALP
jgi:Pyridine nucleotide-disulphide oxidoreductase/Reductase C-terminal